MTLRGLSASLSLLIAVAGAVWATPSQADVITLAKDRSTIENCRIQIISGGRVFVQDGEGKLLEFPLGEIQSLRFDDAPLLAEAEPQLSARRFDEAIPLLLRAAVDAKTNAQRIWALSLLSQAHGGAGQYVQAAGHAASVFGLDDSPYWRSLEPRAPDPGLLDGATFASTAEAMDRLQRARAAVTSTELLAAIDRMIVVIQPVHRKLSESRSGEPYRPNSTLSGIAIAAIRGEQPLSPPGAAAPAGDAGALHPTATGSMPRQASSAARAAAPSTITTEAIDSLLESGDFAGALNACQAVAGNPGDRDIARFLQQFGLALRGVDQMNEAAVMFARCAVLFAGSSAADQSLIELANIYATDYNKPQTARRLLQRALESATARSDSATASLATSALDALPQHAPNASP